MRTVCNDDGYIIVLICNIVNVILMKLIDILCVDEIKNKLCKQTLCAIIINNLIFSFSSLKEFSLQMPLFIKNDFATCHVLVNSVVGLSAPNFFLLFCKCHYLQKVILPRVTFW